ncbi:MAG: PAS domain-containing protein [Desulfobacterales bacterium]|nr:PAS domain-containing protein [Desulfobacterales bacterium]
MTDKSTIEILEKKTKALEETIETQKKSYERMALALCSANIGTWVYDSLNDIYFIDDLAIEILGFKPDNDVAWKEHVHPDDVDYKDVLFNNTERTSCEYEYRVVSDSGDFKWIYDRRKLVERGTDGRANKVFGTLQDITIRKKYEEQLRKSHERTELALFGADLGMFEWNLQNNTFIHDQHSIEILGFDPKDNQTYNRHLHPDDLEKVKALDKAIADGTANVFNIDYRVVTPDGDVRWILDRGKVVEWRQDGKPFRLIGTLQNITDKKKIEDKLNDAIALRGVALDAARLGTWVYIVPDDKVIMDERGVDILGFDPSTGSSWNERGNACKIYRAPIMFALCF